ncbi:hypothetical protein L7F22_067887 [Adiantum nelumboides]|nr:hypothetical protein [Adiantum nelumboides]
MHYEEGNINAFLRQRVNDLEEELINARRQNTNQTDLLSQSTPNGMEDGSIGLYEGKNSTLIRKEYFRSINTLNKSFERLASTRLHSILSKSNPTISANLASDLLQAYFEWWNPLHMYLYRADFYCSLVVEGDNFSPFLLNATLSQGARLLSSGLYTPRDGFNTKLPSPDQFLLQAKPCIIEEIDKGNSSALLQGLLIMAGREASCGHVDQSWLYTSMAIHILKGLNLDKPPKQSAGSYRPIGFQKRELNNRLFWSIYCWDKTLSMTLGTESSFSAPKDANPAFLLDESLDNEVWNPSLADYATVKIAKPFRVSHETCQTTFIFRKFAELCMIIEGILRARYGQNNNSFREDEIGHLHKRLQLWQQGLEGKNVIMKVNDPSTCQFSPQKFQLNMLYHCAYIILHRSSASAQGSNRSAAEICRIHAYQLHDLVRIRERTLGLNDLSYLVCHCLYAAVTIFVQDFRNGSPYLIGEATRQLAFSIQVLEKGSLRSPGMIRALHKAKAELSHPTEYTQIIDGEIGTSTSSLETNTIPSTTPIDSYTSNNTGGEENVADLEQWVFDQAANLGLLFPPNPPPPQPAVETQDPQITTTQTDVEQTTDFNDWLTENLPDFPDVLFSGLTG